MAPPTNRKEILQGLRAQIAKGQAVVGGGAGAGLSAKFGEAGGYVLLFRWDFSHDRENVLDLT